MDGEEETSGGGDTTEVSIVGSSVYSSQPKKSQSAISPKSSSRYSTSESRSLSRSACTITMEPS